MAKSDDNSLVFNFLSEETTVMGDIVLNKDLILEGRIEGDIISKGSVQIESNGYVIGNVYCRDFYCEGIVEGNIKVLNRSELSNNATIKGSMECAYLLTDFDCLIEKGLRLKK